jgi:hypothetical protein
MVLAFCTACSAQWSGPPFPPDATPLNPAEVKELLGLLCPANEYVGQESGCRVCPQATGAPGAKADSTIESAIRGHFLKPDSDDLLLVLYGCSPRARNFRDAFLFTRSASGWFVNKASGLPTGRCRKIASRGGRDALVCFADSSSPDQSSAQLTWAYVNHPEVELARALDNTGGACDAPSRAVVQSAIQQVSFLTGADRKLTVRIVARCRRGPLSPRSRRACTSGPGFEDIGPGLPFRTFRFDYSFDGESLSLTPVGRVSKRAYDACVGGDK